MIIYLQALISLQQNALSLKVNKTCSNFLKICLTKVSILSYPPSLPLSLVYSLTHSLSFTFTPSLTPSLTLTLIHSHSLAPPQATTLKDFDDLFRKKKKRRPPLHFSLLPFPPLPPSLLPLTVLARVRDDLVIIRA